MRPHTLPLLLALLLAVSCKKAPAPARGNERLSKSEILRASGATLSTSQYQYDASGRLMTVASVGGNGTALFTIEYDAAGQVRSSTVTGSGAGAEYRYDFETDGSGRIRKARGTAFSPNLFLDDHTYTYDARGRLVTDSAFYSSGTLNTYVQFEYDDNNNVIAYQHFANHFTSIVNIGRWKFSYDGKRSPWHEIGQLLYTASGGSGVSYFYLSAQNPLQAEKDNTVITPGGGFGYQYYENSLLKRSQVKEANAIVQMFYYSE